MTGLSPLRIRPERPAEFGRIYELVKIAFESAKVAEGDEQDYVTQLRKTPRYLPGLALVAENGNTLIGHIMLTKTQVTGADRHFDALLLSPLAVAVEYRNQGVGARLIDSALKKAAQMG